MRIRPALKPDLGTITSIYSHYVRNTTSTFEIEAPGITEMTRRWSEIATQGLPYLVADVALVAVRLCRPVSAPARLSVYSGRFCLRPPRVRGSRNRLQHSRRDY